MTDHVCLEWALADIFGTTDIVSASGNNRIVFPHVDSCMAVVFLLDGGKALGGHASLGLREGTKTTGDGLYNDSLNDMLTRMVEKAGATKITGIIYVAHPTFGHSIKTCQGAIERLKLVPTNNACKFNKAVDVFMDLGMQKLRVQNSVDDDKRPMDGVPAETGKWLYDSPLNEGMSHYG